MSLTTRLDRLLYPEHGDKWDDVIFREWILAHLGPHTVVLDLGAGTGRVKHMNFKGVAARVCGIDLDPRVESNPMLDEGRVADAERIPYPDASFDVVFADNVMEHLGDPLQVMNEVSRVLRKGGVFLFKTPNKTHYMPTIARVSPHRFHQYVNRIRGRHSTDTFPTYYRANSLRDVRRLASAANLGIERIERMEGRPEYLRMFWATYLAGAIYERFVNGFESLEMFRILLIVQLRK